jgi:hypothetical protein
MKLAAKVNIYVNAEGNPTVQFEPEQEYLELSPLKQALMAHSAVQIGTMVVKQIIAENPECCDEICQHIEASTLEQGTPRPN